MIPGAERIWELSRAFQPSRVLLTGVELGVFAALGTGARTSADVAEQIGTDARATDRFMNALAALDLLCKDGDLFTNSPDADEYLVPGRPDYVGDGLMHIVNLWGSWSTLTAAVRAGTSVCQLDDQAMAAHTKSFIAAMHLIGSSQAGEVVKQLDLSGVRRVVDVGGGSGAYSIEFCRAKPDIEAVVFDLPTVVPLTEEYVKRARMSARITAASGNFTSDELGRDFDLAFLSQVLHSNSPDENLALFKRCHRALNPGGQMVIQEFVVDENRSSPASHVLFALNMLVATRAGDTYTESEIREWLSAASFEDTRRIDPPGTNTTLLVARNA